jgi:hypothetical protein
MSWRSDVLAIIHNRWQIGQEFTLREVYFFEDELSRNHPANKNVRSKIRQTLQALRRDLIIEFLNDRGVYRRRY